VNNGTDSRMPPTIGLFPPSTAGLLRRLVDVRPGEGAAMLWAFAYFFSLLCAYYILRPLRDEMGIAGGVRNLPWLFTGTFLGMLVAVPLFSALVARFPRRTFIPLAYRFFSLNILIFFGLLSLDVAVSWTARAFFIWTSVFNLFVISVFWSYMADLFTNAQGRRLFGFIAAGGSLGALTGPALTTGLVGPLGTHNLLLVSVLLLEAAMFCVGRLNRWAAYPHQGREEPLPAADPADPVRAGEQVIGGGIWAGFRHVAASRYLAGIALFILLFTLTSTFLYLEQAEIVRESSDDPARRTAIFARIDLLVNALTLAIQGLFTGRLIRRFGVVTALSFLPVLTGAGFALLAAAPTLAVLMVFQGLRRAGDYAITRPAREILFTVLPREDKYKSKNFIDTVVYRGGDAVSGWLFAGLGALGMGWSAVAGFVVAASLLWWAVAWWLARRQEELKPGSTTSAAPAAIG
jgi:AAA family ATP:ADP antiporter